jgi:hypothetical protein
MSQNLKCYYKVLPSATKVLNVVTKCHNNLKCCYKMLQSVKSCYEMWQKCQMFLWSVTKVSNLVKDVTNVWLLTLCNNIWHFCNHLVTKSDTFVTLCDN